MAGKSSGGARKGMGFKAAAQNIAAKQGVPIKQANAELAASTRKASPAAKKANPNLNKVKPAKASGSKSSGKGAY